MAGVWDRIGGTGRAVVLLGVGLLGGAAAVAVASVPDGNGVIHACYSATASNGVPVTTGGANLTVIDPSAGQACATTSAAGAPVAQRAISWNQTGPAGAAGPQGMPGPQGQPGPQGPQGPVSTVAAGHTLTISGGQVITVENSSGVTIQPPPLGRVLGAASFGNGLAFNDVLGVSLAGGSTGAGSGAGKVSVHDISITKRIDKSSPVLFKYCSTGKHIPEVTITLRKAGGKPYLTYTLSNVVISSVQAGGSARADQQPTETLSLNFTKVEIKYSKQ